MAEWEQAPVWESAPTKESTWEAAPTQKAKPAEPENPANKDISLGNRVAGSTESFARGLWNFPIGTIAKGLSSGLALATGSSIDEAVARGERSADAISIPAFQDSSKVADEALGWVMEIGKQKSSEITKEWAESEVKNIKSKQNLTQEEKDKFLARASAAGGAMFDAAVIGAPLAHMTMGAKGMVRGAILDEAWKNNIQARPKASDNVKYQYKGDATTEAPKPNIVPETKGYAEGMEPELVPKEDIPQPEVPGNPPIETVPYNVEGRNIPDPWAKIGEPPITEPTGEAARPEPKPISPGIFDQLKEQIAENQRTQMIEAVPEQFLKDKPFSWETGKAPNTRALGGKQRGVINPQVFQEDFLKFKTALTAKGFGLKIRGYVGEPSKEFFDKMGGAFFDQEIPTVNGDNVGKRFIVEAQDMNGEPVAYVAFNHNSEFIGMDHPRAALVADEVQVKDNAQGRAIAPELYKFGAETGSDINSSIFQTDYGREMWDKFAKHGLAQPYRPFANHPEDTMFRIPGRQETKAFTKLGRKQGGWIKNAGGNWHDDALKVLTRPIKEGLGDMEVWGPDDPRTPARARQYSIINNMVDKYIKKSLGTPNDPNKAVVLPSGRTWEQITDEVIHGRTARTDYEFLGIRAGETQWDIRPTKAYNSFTELSQYLKHTGEYLQQKGYTEKQLQSLNFPKLIQEVVAWDKELAANMSKTRAAEKGRSPIYKEYDDGFYWQQLTKPGQFARESDAMGHSVRGYEPPAKVEDTSKLMTDLARWAPHPDWTKESGNRGSRHYGLGGWEAIKRDDARVYSLRDKDGNSVTTIEVAKRQTDPESFYNNETESFKAKYPKPQMERYEKEALERAASEQGDSPNARREYSRIQNVIFGNQHKRMMEWADKIRETPEFKRETEQLDITQIKGKENSPPSNEVVHHVQDFVRSGKWGEVGDIENAQLIENIHDKFQRFLTEQEIRDLPNSPRRAQWDDAIMENNNEGPYDPNNWAQEQVLQNQAIRGPWAGPGRRQRGAFGWKPDTPPPDLNQPIEYTSAAKTNPDGSLKVFGNGWRDKLEASRKFQQVSEFYSQEVAPRMDKITEAFFPLAARSKRETNGDIKTAIREMETAKRMAYMFDDKLTRGYSVDELNRMGDVRGKIEELKNPMRRGSDGGLEKKSPTEIAWGQQEAVRLIEALPEHMKNDFNLLEHHQKGLAKEAIDAGVLEEGLDYYHPREYVRFLSDGTIGQITDDMVSGRIGVSTQLRQTIKNLKGRSLGPEREAGLAEMRRMFGEDVGLLKDIRILPKVMMDLEHVIIARKLINQMAAYAARNNTDILLTGKDNARPPGWITISNPLFMKEGEMVHVHPDYAPGIQQVFQQLQKGGFERFVNVLEDLKGKSSQTLLFNPIVHNSVIFFKALPFLGRDAFNGYIEGYNLRHGTDYSFAQMAGRALTSADAWTKQEMTTQGLDFMKDAGRHGVVFMDQRAGMRDVTDVYQPPGERSWTALALGKPLEWFGAKGAAERLYGGIDKAGDIVYNNGLWNRVADLQGFIYHRTWTDLVDNLGLDPEVAKTVGARFANEYGGAIPWEDTSAGLRHLLNFTFFSRSFRGTNAAIYKDVIQGLPNAMQGQIISALKAKGKEMDYINQQLKTANNYTKKKQIIAMAIDIAVTGYLVNAAIQSAYSTYMQWADGKELGQILGDGKELFKKRIEDGLKSVNSLNPDEWYEAGKKWLPQYHNEPGKEFRVAVGHNTGAGNPDQVVYAKIPSSRVGEELTQIVENQGEYIKSARSQYLKAGFGIYDNWDNTTSILGNMGMIVKEVGKGFLPQTAVDNIMALNQTSPKRSDILKATVGVLSPVSISVGHPAGPEAGVMAAEKRHQDFLTQQLRPEIKKAFEHGEDDKAYKLMDSVGMTPREQASMAISSTNPMVRKNALKFWIQHATPQEQERLQNVNR